MGQDENVIASLTSKLIVMCIMIAIIVGFVYAVLTLFEESTQVAQKQVDLYNYQVEQRQLQYADIEKMIQEM